MSKLYHLMKVRKSNVILWSILLYSYLTLRTLDNEREALVQEGFDGTQQNWSSITIADRFSTIENAA
jgi:ABC-type transport system involved in Fe-S cluster assembly fused permease/ATPase subunit